MAKTRTIELTEVQAKKMYEDTKDSGVKQILEANFDKKLFRKNILEWDDITFNDICVLDGTTEEKFNIKWDAISKFSQDNFGEPISLNSIAFEKLKLIRKVLNTDENGNVWSPDPDSTTEQRWYPYFYFAPFRFDVTHCNYGNVWAFCGLRLCSKSKSVANFFGTHFTKEWEEFLKK
jgi:hypothetical protein